MKKARLGVYQDGPFRLVEAEGGVRVAPDPVDAPFLRFASAVADEFDGFVIFARIVGADDMASKADARAEPARPEVASQAASRPVLLPGRVEVVRLPDYGSLSRLPAVARAGFRTATAFWRGLSRVDVVWAFGPHPFQFMLVTLAALRGRRVVLGVRQDTPAYFRARLPSPRWKPVLLGIRAMDAFHRLLARRVPATVVGTANAARYSAGRRRVLAMAPSLVSAADVVDRPGERDWTGEIELLTVGRIDPEKNPFLVAELVASLEASRPGRYRLRWVGVGPLAVPLHRRAAELGVGDRLELAGYVPFGPELLDLYRHAHAFVHVSLTEGVPQVLVEALASGTPVVATDVGGVRSALDEGRAGLLVPPADVDALVGAILQLSDDEGLRTRLVDRGLDLARERTLEAEAARVADFLRDDLENRAAGS